MKHTSSALPGPGGPRGNEGVQGPPKTAGPGTDARRPLRTGRSLPITPIAPGAPGDRRSTQEDVRHVDCARCPAGPDACSGCMITALLGMNADHVPPQESALRDGETGVSVDGLALDRAEQQAVEMFFTAGLISATEVASVFATADHTTAHYPATAPNIAGRPVGRRIGVA